MFLFDIITAFIIRLVMLFYMLTGMLLVSMAVDLSPVEVFESKIATDKYCFTLLDWGMSEEEVNEIVTIKPTSEVVSGKQNLLIYEDIDFFEHTAELTLTFTEEHGLKAFTYHIDGDEFEDLYGCLYMKYGTQHRGSFDYKTWYPYEKNFYIYLSTHEENGNTVTQCGFYPVE